MEFTCSIVMGPDGRLAMVEHNGGLSFPHAHVEGDALQSAFTGLEQTGIEELRVLARLEPYERQGSKIHTFIFECKRHSEQDCWVDIEDAAQHLIDEDKAFYMALQRKLTRLRQLNQHLGYKKS